MEVRGPTNESVRHSTNKRPDGTTEISFRPTSVGLYNGIMEQIEKRFKPPLISVNIEFNNKPLHGSPYRVEVVDPTRVLVNDTDFRNDGIWPIILGRRNVVDIDAIAAGPGILESKHLCFQIVEYFPLSSIAGRNTKFRRRTCGS